MAFTLLSIVQFFEIVKISDHVNPIKVYVHPHKRRKHKIQTKPLKIISKLLEKKTLDTRINIQTSNLAWETHVESPMDCTTHQYCDRILLYFGYIMRTEGGIGDHCGTYFFTGMKKQGPSSHQWLDEIRSASSREELRIALRQ